MTIPHKVYNGSSIPDTPGHFECSECRQPVSPDDSWCNYCKAAFGVPRPSGILEAMKARAARENETVEEWLRWTPQAFSEIEKFPCRLLKHRFPHVPNFSVAKKRLLSESAQGRLAI